MPYERYPGNNSRRPNNQGYNSNGVSPWGGGGGGGGGGMNRSGLLPTPGGNNANLDQLTLAGNLLGSLLNGGNAPMANIANQLSLAQALQKPSPLMGPVVGGLRGPNPGNRSMMRRQRRDSPVRNRNSFRRRSRSRSPRNQRRLSDRPSTGRRNHKNNSNEEDHRPEHEIYIGNYPLKFREHDVRKLFAQHNVMVKTIRMKHDGQKVFAFAETTSKSEIQKAIAAMDSKEINGRRLRVRAAGDKDPPKKDKPKKELTTAHVTRHLVYAFIEFLDRELDVDEMPEERIEQIKTVQEKLRTSFNIESEDSSLKVSRNLELIFMQNNRREIKVPDDDEVEEEKVTSVENKETSVEKVDEEADGESQSKKRKLDTENSESTTQEEKDENDAEDDEEEEEEEVEFQEGDDCEEEIVGNEEDNNEEKEEVEDEDEEMAVEEDEDTEVKQENEEEEEEEEEEAESEEKNESKDEEKDVAIVDTSAKAAPATRAARGRNKAKRGKK
uniref:RRM domain-containing protein n=1 Tax=Lepeophtheirus salmonis TaxID=72036 RepID=A0A0K2TSQ7_LEPSM